jgi:hypothetical protein
MPPKITWKDEALFDDVAVRSTRGGLRAGGVTGGTAAASPLPAFLADAQVQTVLEPIEVRQRRMNAATVLRGGLPSIAADVVADADEEYILIVRHPSGALTFHAGNETAPANRRGASPRKPVRRASGKRTIQLRATLAPSSAPEARRGVFGDIFDGVVDAIIVRVGKAIAATTVELAEAAIWRLLGRERGFYRVTKSGLLEGKLERAGSTKAGPSGRALLLLHGTFSTTASAFRDLATSDFFDDLAAVYGDAIYGFVSIR